MHGYIYAVLILLAVGAVLFLLDQPGLWLERKGLLYYRNTNHPAAAPGLEMPCMSCIPCLKRM